MFIVKRPMTETLADYIRRVRNDKGLSTQNVEEASRGGITDGYVNRIENGYIKNVSPEKLKALAKGLGVPEAEVFAVARGAKQKGSRLIDEIINYLPELTLPRQRDILSFVKMFYDEAIAHRQEVETPGIKYIARGAGVKDKESKVGRK